jgi:polyribonucleotide nucleotidyltransferase
MSEVEEQLASTQEKLETLEKENDARESEVRFNSRMELLNEIYQLDDDDSKIVASELSSLDESEESFAQYQEKLAKVWKHKNKEFIAAEQKAFEDRVAQEVEKRISEASETSQESEISETAEASEAQAAEETQEDESADEVSEALDSLEVEEAAVVNNNEASSQKDSLRERFAKTFKESVKISY